MSHKVVFGRRASDDLEDLLIYLSPEMGAEQARTYVGKIQSYCLGFSTFPKRGMLRDDIRPGIRLVGYRYKATIAFFVEEDVVFIARIFHRGRNVDLDDSSDLD
ncbi:type II toxin-antitoxin system RelE/ParE family toxin [Neorhizobium galegae]|uniref:type II toxin-antitoxin system RelE/ParE family toxin n=1 Tax=Neorhizobium galegae TaxID=399 RepID=UPI00062111DE|nr:type II toxin-antitoxin system RelE/ParE family toxin [Neorhizobium galegae]UIK06450.1 type II toxin-antitoxin system RelE/ParE family toxin [Neorhizobium galegae]CDZ73077.1 Plasmid stabilization system protein [Neorhizobium galegae bv. orientalis]